MKNYLKSEKGSMAVYVIVTIFSFIIILTGVFLNAASIRKNQLRTLPQIKAAYEKDLEKKDEIYEGRKENEVVLAYVRDKLILHYDGLNNTGEGHSNTTTTWKDLSENGNDATVTGGTWNDNSVMFSTSDTSNGIKTNANFPIDFSNKTFNILFKYSQLSSVAPIFGARTTSSNGFMIFNYKDTNALNLDTIGSTTRKVVGEFLQDNTNYNLTFVFSEATVKTYKNGILHATETITTGNLNFPLTIFTAGARANSLGNVYSVKVYDKSLTEEEIQQNYQVDKNKYGF